MSENTDMGGAVPASLAAPASPNGANSRPPTPAAGNPPLSGTPETVVPDHTYRSAGRGPSRLKALLGLEPIRPRSAAMVRFLLEHPNASARWYAQSVGTGTAERIITRGTPRLERLVARADDLRMQAADLDTQSAGIEDRVLIDHRGVASTVAVARQYQDRLIKRLDEDELAGSTAHRRHGGLVMLSKVGLLFDLVAYVLFTSFVFNVRWDQPGPDLIAAIAFAVFAFWATERFSSLAGRTLHGWKRGGTVTPEGDWPRRPVVGTGLAVGTAPVAVAPAALMFTRVRYESTDAGVPETAGVLLAVALALFAFLAPLIVMYAEFSNGSTLTDDLDKLKRPLAQAQAEQKKLGQRAEGIRRRADRLNRTAERYRGRLLGRARVPVLGADQMILFAHALADDQPEPGLDDRPGLQPRQAQATPVGLLTDGTTVVSYGLDSLTGHMSTPLFAAPAVGGRRGEAPDTPELPMPTPPEAADPQDT